MKKAPLSAVAVGFIFTPFILEGCSGSSSAAPNPFSRSIHLVPYRDPWTVAQPRFMDIADRPFTDTYAKSFVYDSTQVTLYYDPDPQKPYFVGKIVARGLKPNFAYQLKLAGKPQYGSRGWGTAGDDFSNEAIGRVARWWNDSKQSNTVNSDFENNYKNAPEYKKQTIYGYLFMGDFVTDQNGNAEREFSGSKSYHITWQDKQDTTLKEAVAGTFRAGSTTPPYIGYGKSTPPVNVKLWYEYESGRPRDVKLPAGNYNCRVLITEESFHSTRPYDKGGTWKTVLATEDLDANDQPNANTADDVVFRIR